MDSSINPFEVLGIDADSTEPEIKKRYRLLSKKFHPDVNPGDSQAEERFKLIQWAYDHITHCRKQGLCEKGTSNAQPPGGHSVDPQHPFMSFFEALKSYGSKRTNSEKEGQG